MIKQAFISTLIVVTQSTSSFAAFSTEPGDSLVTRIHKGLFETVKYGDIPLIYPVGLVAEMMETDQQEALLRNEGVFEDALFFKKHVVSSHKGYSTTDIYAKMKIKLAQGENLTQTVRMGENTTKEVSIASAAGIITVNQLEGWDFKVNGRPIISDRLFKAHMAAQHLIFDQVISVPDHLKDQDGGIYRASTTATQINQLMLEHIQK